MNKKSFPIGLGIGLVLGGIVALLTSPQKGKDTRKLIADKVMGVKNTVAKKIKAVKEA